METGKAVFMKKVVDLEQYWDDLKMCEDYFGREPEEEQYIVEEEEVLDNEEFEEFTSNFFKEYYERGEYGGFEGDMRKVLKYINKDTDEVILVDPQGYEYCRYVAVL